MVRFNHCTNYEQDICAAADTTSLLDPEPDEAVGVTDNGNGGSDVDSICSDLFEEEGAYKFRKRKAHFWVAFI